MKDTNYLATMAITGIILLSSTAYLAATTNAFTPQNTTITPELTIPRFEAIPEQTIDCKLCHEQPETLPKHKNGGEYCKACHGDNLHELHTSDKTVNLTCQRCHTNNATTPQRLPGHTTICDTCHNYPDPLQPSNGNLINIHTKRGYTCDTCHIQDLQSLHEKT